MIIDDNLRAAIVAAAIEIEEHPGELYVDEITEIIVRHIKAVKTRQEIIEALLNGGEL